MDLPIDRLDKWPIHIESWTSNQLLASLMDLPIHRLDKWPIHIESWTSNQLRTNLTTKQAIDLPDKIAIEIANTQPNEQLAYRTSDSAMVMMMMMLGSTSNVHGFIMGLIQDLNNTTKTKNKTKNKTKKLQEIECKSFFGLKKWGFLICTNNSPN